MELVNLLLGLKRHFGEFRGYARLQYSIVFGKGFCLFDLIFYGTVCKACLSYEDRLCSIHSFYFLL